MRSTLSRFSKIAFPLVLAPAAGWLALDRPDAAAAVARERAVPSATVLQLAGKPVGTLRSAAGGSAVGTVVVENPGAGAAPKKHVGTVGYEDLELELDLSFERSVYDWIAASWAGNAQRKFGALVSLDPNGSAQTAREFQNALITEVTFPACDAASKEAGFISLVLAPERVTHAATAGKAASPGAKGKVWLASNFKLEIDGLDTTRVVRVDPIQFKQPVVAGDVGKLRDPGKPAAGIHFENLRITLAEAGSDSWRSWHEDFAIKGNSSDKNERSGRLLLLGPNLKDELARIELSNLGIIALRPRAASATVRQLEAELYVERMALSVGK